MTDKNPCTKRERAAHMSYGGILKYTGLLGGVQILQVLISVVRNKCAAVLIGRYGMGITDVLNRTTDMFGSLTNLGLPVSGVRAISEQYYGEDNDKLQSSIVTIRLWCVMTGIVGMLLCAILADAVNRLFFAGSLPRHFLLYISPVVLFTAIYGGEAAILKGTRQLWRLASASVWGTFFSLIVTVAFYVTLGIRGIPWALQASSAALLITALCITHKLYPWKLRAFTLSHLKAGKALLALGVSYISAGLAGSGAEMLVRSYISHGSLADVGLYASGFAICVTYTRIVFVAMDAEYFPRLSAIGNNIADRNHAVARQIEICTLLMSPMIVALLVLLPLMIAILYNSEFNGAIGMCVLASGYLFLKAIIAPIEYIPLANNDSIVYFVMELIYDAAFVLFIVLGYGYYGIRGAGVALTASYALDIVLILIVYGIHYKFRLSRSTIKIIVIQGIIVAAAIVLFSTGYRLSAYIAGTILFFVSALYSLRVLRLTPARIKEILHKRLKK